MKGVQVKQVRRRWRTVKICTAHDELIPMDRGSDRHRIEKGYLPNRNPTEAEGLLSIHTHTHIYMYVLRARVE